MISLKVIQFTFALVFSVGLAQEAAAETTTVSSLNQAEPFQANKELFNSSQFIQKVSVGSYYYYSCNPNPCQNGGSCVTDGYSCRCSCQYGYSGDYCQTYTSINSCYNYQCSGGQICVRQVNGQPCCQCPSGYYGPNCLSTTRVCDPNPCYNGAACIQTGPTTASCKCPTGYSGDLCQFCNNPCSVNPCQNGGYCTPIYNGNNNLYKCQCLNGFAGPNCESIYNPCYTNGVCNCQNGGICTVNYNTYPYYQCQCANGYSGSNCQNPPYVPISNCNDVDPFNCPTYAAQNFCSNTYTINGVSIPNYCAKSCGKCLSSSCIDTHASCGYWKTMGYCNLYPVNSYCRMTCSLC